MGYYRTIDDYNAYFANRLYDVDWSGATRADKIKAATMATAAAERIAYTGAKSSAVQVLSFPQYPWTDFQQWILTITATGGTYTLTVNGTTTSNIAYNADATAIATATGLTVTGAGPFVLTASTSVGTTVEIDTTNLTGGSATVVTLADGIPDEFFWGVAEEARSLIAARDAEQEFRNLWLTSDGAGSTRVTLDVAGPPEHSAHFFTSPLAWYYIARYVDPDNTFDLNRL